MKWKFAGKSCQSVVRASFRNDGIEVAESIFADSKAHESLEILLGYRGSPGIFGALEDASKFGGQDPDTMFCRTTNALLKSNKNNSPNKRRSND